MSEPDSDPTEKIAARLAPVISAAAERIHYAESRRANYSVMAGALIAAGITILTFALGTIEIEWIRYGAGFGAIGMLLAGSIVLYVFGQQTNRYPFTSATKTWKWFYRDALPDQKAFDPKPWHRWSTQVERVKKAYDDQLPLFQQEMHKLADAKTNLDQDIQQAYVLHINEKYKNLHLSRLRSLFNRGLIAVMLLTFAGVVIGLWHSSRDHEIRVSQFSNRGWTEQVEYRLASSPLSGQAEFSVKISVSNKTGRDLTVGNIIAKDKRGWVLPITATYANSTVRKVASHKEGMFWATIKADRPVAEEIESLHVGAQ